jgi:DNA-binding Lrp family transcriptional regulator
MPKALVLIDTDPYSAEEVLQELMVCKEVTEVFMVTGVYDVVAKVEAATFEELVGIINRKIKRLFQVQEMLSMMIVEAKTIGKEQENGAILVETSPDNPSSNFL